MLKQPGVLSSGRSLPKLTVAVPFPVYPPIDGGQQRVFALYGHIARHFTVDIVSLAEADSRPLECELAPGMKEIRIPKSHRHQEEEARMAHRVGGRPIGNIATSLLVDHTPEYGRRLARSIETANLVIACYPYCIPVIRNALGGRPLAYDAHDLEYISKKRALNSFGVSGAYVAETVRQSEAEVCHSSRLIVCCSEQDADGISRLYDIERARILVAPNGVDTDVIRFTSRDVKERVKAEFGLTGERIALSVGSSHPSNLEAAEAILEIARAVPKVKFLLAGSHCVFLADRRLPANVGLMGVVDDETMSAVLDLADVALNPMLGASGSNPTVAMYLAAGVPMITTSSGANGYELVDGDHALLRRLEEFPEAIRQLLNDRAMASGLATRGRCLAELRHDWRGIASRVTSAFRSLLSFPTKAAGQFDALVDSVSVAVEELQGPVDHSLIQHVSTALAEMAAPEPPAASIVDSTKLPIDGESRPQLSKPMSPKADRRVDDQTQHAPTSPESRESVISTGDMEKDWDRRATLNARYFIECTHHRTEEEFQGSGDYVVTNIILRDISLDSRATVLEIGCGIGRLLKPLAQIAKELHGVDVSGEMIGRAREQLKIYPHVHLHRTSGSDLKMLPDASVDFCFSFITFQHVPRKRVIYGYFREVSRTLKAGGIFRFQVDGRANEKHRLDDAGTWEGVVFSEREIRDELSRCAFDILHMTGHDTQYFLITARRQTEPNKPTTHLVRLVDRRWREAAVRALLVRLGANPIDEWIRKLLHDLATVRDLGAEFIHINRQLTDTEYVTHVYRTLLARDPDEEGLRYYSIGLGRQTFTRTEVFQNIINSREFSSRLLADEPGVP